MFQEIKKQQKIKRKYYHNREKKRQTQSQYKSDKDLNKRLLIMFGGNEKAAVRLLSNVRKNNSGKSNVWYQEKIISELERDRR